MKILNENSIKRYTFILNFTYSILNRLNQKTLFQRWGGFCKQFFLAEYVVPYHNHCKAFGFCTGNYSGSQLHNTNSL
ncbi:hypothetical protein NIES4103_47800 [Nostoc sp. NIES-4103]|nr:hypothetical protein NIES4103_47800 [Nostoc sp. NIES-4103]